MCLQYCYCFIVINLVIFGLVDRDYFQSCYGDVFVFEVLGFGVDLYQTITLAEYEKKKSIRGV